MWQDRSNHQDQYAIASILLSDGPAHKNAADSSKPTSACGEVARFYLLVDCFSRSDS